MSRWTDYRLSVFLGPLLVFLAVFMWLIAMAVARAPGPSGAGYGSDFAVFYEAAKVMQSAKNPYDAGLLWRWERSDFARQGLEIPHDRALVRVGNPPLFFWALRPLTSLPFRPAAIIWTGALYLLSALALIILLRWLRWRSYALPAAIFLTTPQVVLGAFYGDVIGLILAAIALGIACIARYPFVAGAVLSMCWLKPHVALPAALLIWAFYTTKRTLVAIGFVSATVGLAVLTVAAVGSSGIRAWVSGLLGWSRSISGQPEMASLTGLYYLWAPAALRLALQVALIGLALTATMVVSRRSSVGRRGSEIVACLWVLWLLCSPYAHVNDAILLTPAVLTFLGKGDARSLRLPALLALYLFAGCLVLNRIPGLPIDFESLKLAAVVGLMLRSSLAVHCVSSDNRPGAGSMPESPCAVA